MCCMYIHVVNKSVYFFFLIDVDAKVSTIIDLAVQINFKRLMTIFNIIMACSVGSMNKVQERILFGGAAQIQAGFIAKRKVALNSRG